MSVATPSPKPVSVWKKKPPQELKVHLLAAERTLLQLQKENEQKAAESREAAKSSLRLGDNKGYHGAARRYSLAQRQHRMVTGLLETVQGLRDILEAHIGLHQAVIITEEIQRVQSNLGMDASPLKEAIRHVRTGMYTVEHQAEQINKMMKSVSLGEATHEELEAVHEELLAEIEKEATIGRRIKEELYKEARPTGGQSDR